MVIIAHNNRYDCITGGKNKEFSMRKNKQEKGKLLAADLAECALFVALMVAGTYISIPFYPVPLTFQTVVCVLSGLLLGWKKGLVAMATYVALGLIGVPVFSGGSGGLASVFKPTFGYIIGFVLAALAAGLIRGNAQKVQPWRYLLAAFAAFLVNYACGIAYFIPMWIYYYGGMATWKQYLVLWNLLYMPKDLLLCAMAAYLSWRVVPAIERQKRVHNAAEWNEPCSDLSHHGLELKK
jgi:biotin transport system substrate-specific component